MKNSTIEARLTELGLLLSKIQGDTKEYLLSLRRLTSEYIDQSSAARRAGRVENCLSLCYRYTARIYESSQTAIPGRLAHFISDLSELRATAGQTLSGGELLDFYKRADTLAENSLALSGMVTQLSEPVLSEYLKNLSISAEGGEIMKYSYNLPVGFLRVLDTLI